MILNHKILIAEDELILQLMLHNMLKKMGFTGIEVVSKGSEVIEMCSKFHFDLILMDIILADDIDGIEAYRIIKSQKQVPVIYITGNTDYIYRKRAEALGFVDYLPKPVTYNQLKDIIIPLFSKS